MKLSLVGNDVFLNEEYDGYFNNVHSIHLDNDNQSASFYTATAGGSTSLSRVFNNDGIEHRDVEISEKLRSVTIKQSDLGSALDILSKKGCVGAKPKKSDFFIRVQDCISR